MSSSQESLLPSHYRSKQAFLASLPPWRRLLAKLNWHPTIESKVQRYALQQQGLACEKRTRQLLHESEQIKKQTEQIRKEVERMRKEDERMRKEDERLAALNARIDALLFNSATSLTPAPPTDDCSAT